MPKVAQARTLHRKALFCDLVFPFPASLHPLVEEKLKAMKSNGVDFVSLTLAIDIGASPETCMKRIGEYKRFIRKNAEEYLFANSVSDIRNAKELGKLAIGFHFQGSEALQRDLNLVEPFYDAGIRWMIIAYNLQNSSGFGCMDESDLGLTRYGASLVEEMNKVGMLVDLSHCGYRTSMDAIARSAAPVIFSHSLAHKVYGHNRNLKDDQIRALAENGGIIGVMGVGPFLCETGEANAARITDHVDYIANLVGPEHISFANDTMVDKEMVYAFDKANPGLAGMGKPPPWDFLEVEDYESFTGELLKRGYTETEVLGILGENFLRVAKQVWRP